MTLQPELPVMIQQSNQSNTQTDPSTYTTLQNDLDTAHARGHISSPVITDAQARALPFLQAVIQEGLRLFPPAASGAFWKRVPDGGDTVCGVRLPAGCLVGTAQPVWVASREDGFWGDGGVFRPGRWYVSLVLPFFFPFCFFWVGSLCACVACDCWAASLEFGCLVGSRMLDCLRHREILVEEVGLGRFTTAH